MINLKTNVTIVSKNENGLPQESWFVEKLVRKDDEHTGVFRKQLNSYLQMKQMKQFIATIRIYILVELKVMLQAYVKA